MKIFIYILSLLIIFLQNLEVSANNIKIDKVIEKTSQNYQKNISIKWPWEKIVSILLLEKYINRYKNNPEISYIFEEIKKNIFISDFSKYFENHTKKFLINSDEIKNYWLNLHNSKRQNHWLKNYTYSKKLENTALEWSYNNYFKQSMDHKRDYRDGWYDSTKVNNWFVQRWVNCPVSWYTRESESIAKYGFYCNDWECSEEFKESLKVIFDIYYAEKYLSYPENAHYLAIVSKNLKTLWVWYTLYQTADPEYYEYYLTTHYCTK